MKRFGGYKCDANHDPKHYAFDLSGAVTCLVCLMTPPPPNLELMRALIESVKLQSHYAMLLNMHDGGERHQFSSVAEWIERLKTVGAIPLEPSAERKP